MELHVFDFDSTLFWSPNMPERGESNLWWPNSLSTPYVPDVPGPEWWNHSVLTEVLLSLQNPNHYTMLVTGRSSDLFQDRILELLRQQKLAFNSVHLCPPGDHTPTWKGNLFKSMVGDYERVHLWDDRKDYLNYYQWICQHPNIVCIWVREKRNCVLDRGVQVEEYLRKVELERDFFEETLGNLITKLKEKEAKINLGEVGHLRDLTFKLDAVIRGIKKLR